MAWFCIIQTKTKFHSNTSQIQDKQCVGEGREKWWLGLSKEHMRRKWEGTLAFFFMVSQAPSLEYGPLPCQPGSPANVQRFQPPTIYTHKLSSFVLPPSKSPRWPPPGCSCGLDPNMINYSPKNSWRHLSPLRLRLWNLFSSLRSPLILEIHKTLPGAKSPFH